MGCKHSRPQVQPVGEAAIAHDNINIKKTLSDVSEYDIDEHTGMKTRKRNKKSKTSKNKRNLGSNVSLDDGRSLQDSDRGNSASSKASKASADSGLGGYDDAYAHVITEESDPDKVRKIEEGFVADDNLDLGVSGVACPVRLSAKDKDRLEESMIMQSLREEGLISRPQNQSQGGTSFEIIDATNAKEGGALRPPPRLAKLEKRRKKKKTLTEEEIKEKLERAERRKKKKEQERLNKIKTLEKADINNALEQFEISQKQKETQVTKKLDQVSDNREKRLKEIREKIKQREEHAAMVRKRKELAKLEGLDKYDPNEEYPTPQNDQ